MTRQVEKAAKCLDLMKSSSDGEALAAGRALVRIMDGEGLTHIFEDNIKLKAAIADQERAARSRLIEINELRALKARIMKRPLVVRRLLGVTD